MSVSGFLYLTQLKPALFPVDNSTVSTGIFSGRGGKNLQRSSGRFTFLPCVYLVISSFPEFRRNYLVFFNIEYVYRKFIVFPAFPIVPGTQRLECWVYKEYM